MWYPEIDTVFHLGTSRVQYSIESTTRRMEGSGGKMYSFWAMNSFRMSFCRVPLTCENGTPCCSATARYMQSRTAAGELIVIDVETPASGIPSNSVSMSASESIATPQWPI